MSCSFSLFTIAASWNVAESSPVSHGHMEEFGRGHNQTSPLGDGEEVAASMGNSPGGRENIASSVVLASGLPVIGMRRGIPSSVMGRCSRKHSLKP